MVMQVWIIPNKVISEPGNLLISNYNRHEMTKFGSLDVEIFRSLVWVI